MRRHFGSKRHLARASNAYCSRMRSFEFCLPTKGTTVKVKNRSHPAMERELWSAERQVRSATNSGPRRPIGPLRLWATTRPTPFK